VRVAIHQPEYLGYLGFYNKMMNADAWIYLDNVQLAKRDFMRRNRIAGQHGELMLSVPIQTKGRYYQLIQDVEIDNTQDWRASHWKSIQQSYGRAPHFHAYAPEYAAIYQQSWDKLVDLNIRLIETTARLLGIERPKFRASELAVTGKSSQLLADLTLAGGGDSYLSGPMGRDYLDETLFHQRGLQVVYNDFTHPTYSQGPHEFVPYLAAIDLLFNCGPASLETIAQGGVFAQRQGIS
jgi:hypothetical protein